MSDPGDPPGGPGSAYLRYGAQVPLLVAAGVTFVQGLLTAIFGISESFSISSHRLVLGLTNTAFFVAYGAALIWCAWGLYTVRSWARGPVLFAQLLWLGLAWNFRNGSTWPIAVALTATALVVLAGLLHRSSMAVLNREPPPGE
ncbi:MAG: hypothetical protein M3130_10925 [Actinomycetota bacterium]|nr:hypothetical protein [Actinomycetota bacterium]